MTESSSLSGGTSAVLGMLSLLAVFERLNQKSPLGDLAQWESIRLKPEQEQVRFLQSPHGMKALFHGLYLRNHQPFNSDPLRGSTP